MNEKYNDSPASPTNEDFKCYLYFCFLAISRNDKNYLNFWLVKLADALDVSIRGLEGVHRQKQPHDNTKLKEKSEQNIFQKL